jgi:TPR repeat protein
MRWLRKAAENGHAESCGKLAARMYLDMPYAREVGHVVEAVGVTSSAGVMEGHDVPSDVLTSVVYCCGKGGLICSKSSTRVGDWRRRGPRFAATAVARLWAS